MRLESSFCTPTTLGDFPAKLPLATCGSMEISENSGASDQKYSILSTSQSLASPAESAVRSPRAKSNRVAPYPKRSQGMPLSSKLADSALDSTTIAPPSPPTSPTVGGTTIPASTQFDMATFTTRIVVESIKHIYPMELSEQSMDAIRARVDKAIEITRVSSVETLTAYTWFLPRLIGLAGPGLSAEIQNALAVDSTLGATPESAAESTSANGMQKQQTVKLLACMLLMISNKTLSDSPFKAKCWAKMFDVRLEALTALERYFLSLVSWDCRVNQQVIQQVIKTTRAWLRKLPKVVPAAPSI